jgi:hypothetical protein
MDGMRGIADQYQAGPRILFRVLCAQRERPAAGA